MIHDLKSDGEFYYKPLPFKDKKPKSVVKPAQLYEYQYLDYEFVSKYLTGNDISYKIRNHSNIVILKFRKSNNDDAVHSIWNDSYNKILINTLKIGEYSRGDGIYILNSNYGLILEREVHASKLIAESKTIFSRPSMVECEKFKRVIMLDGIE